MVVYIEKLRKITLFSRENSKEQLKYKKRIRKEI